MLTYERGCLIAALKSGRVQAIAHQANCWNTMGSGVAKYIREAFPEAYAVDCATKRGDIRKLGGFTMAQTIHGPVFNLYGQYTYGRDGTIYTKYDALQESMENMVRRLRHDGFSGTLGLPMIGAGSGGGDWGVIEKIILHSLRDYNVVVFSL